MNSSKRTSVQPDQRKVWRGILDRDRRLDGVVYYGVTSTRIYCRPTCPSRRPRPDRIVLFADQAAAKAAGFRACKRCKPDASSPCDRAHEIVREACAEMCRADSAAIDVRSLAERVGVGERQLRQSFQDVLGVSPSRFADAVRFARFRSALKIEADVTSAIYSAGFEAPSRAYENASRRLGMTPGEYKRGAPTQVIRRSIDPCPLGSLLVAGTEKGLCCVSLGRNARDMMRDLRAEFPNARVEEADAHIREWARALVKYLEGRSAWPLLPLDVCGTAFQATVWEALRRIPAGRTATYSEIAKAIGEPRSARAVARACATNPVALAIPCHRVVPASGGEGGYRWGSKRKAALLELEMSR